MADSYDQIAGHSVERLAALSDGVFAVAMTLLVLDLRAPAVEAIHSEQDLWRAFQALAPRLLMYIHSFMTLGSSGLATDAAQSPGNVGPELIVASHRVPLGDAVRRRCSRSSPNIAWNWRLLGKRPA